MTPVQAAINSPFHAGEQLAQQRAGMREKIEKIGRRHIRDYLPDQHREFYAALPFVLLGAVDGFGRPWASIVAGQPGFISSPDDRTLDIAGRLANGDPLKDALKPGTDVGLLGIQLETRRRNRLSGRIAAADAGKLSIEVKQTFGNCPKYIQTRAVEYRRGIELTPTDTAITTSSQFDSETRALIERSDTLFVATAYLDGPDNAARGADVSHRGGKPGFVCVADERSLVLPDFSGNLHFNTIGNILANPRAGFLFLDFDTGDLVYMTGRAEIIWSGPDVDAFAGAERLIRFGAEEIIRVENGLPLRFDFGEFSPKLEATGSWPAATD